jgi:serine/alanine adding enzyme
MQPIRASNIKYADGLDRELWDSYVRNHSDASLFHEFGWRDVIHRAYGHTAYYLMAYDEEPDAIPRSAEDERHAAGRILGVLPLVHLKHRIFGNSLVSLPFVDSGGILASTREAEECLLLEAVKIGRETNANRIELRHERLLAACNESGAFRSENSQPPLQITARSSKVRMLLNLPDSSQTLMKSFKSKLRSQITKSLNAGFTLRTGGVELLDDFYKVFVVNMRDLGSPVHSIALMRHVLGEFSERSRILVIYKGAEPVASALVIGSDKVLRNPWASSLRKYASLGPNMLLYLRMLEFACDNGYRVFDFGRSTEGEGTYKFKEQWGAVPEPLYWYYISLDGKSLSSDSLGTEKFERAAHYWRKLPLVVTRMIGPRIRKHISL